MHLQQTKSVRVPLIIALPDGYGAWYAYMQEQGIPIKRWQKPFVNLKPKKNPITLLQIYGSLVPSELTSLERTWVEAGNTLIVLGVRQPPTTAKFTTLQKSPQGDVKIETTRRHQSKKKVQISLSDRFGGIVWERQLGKGKIIYSTTPYLAANAYQDYQSNYQYLAELVTQKDHVLFVDEYIHGYRDNKQDGAGENNDAGRLWRYLANTPVFPVFIQTGVLFLVLVFAQNNRLGKPIFLNKPVVDNSEAYIQALAGVLQKAESADFVVEMVGKEELLQLQKDLGLLASRVEQPSQINHEELLQAWRQHTGTSDTQLNAILKLYSRSSQQQPIKDKDLIDWLNNWDKVKQVLSEKETGKRE